MNSCIEVIVYVVYVVVDSINIVLNVGSFVFIFVRFFVILVGDNIVIKFGIFVICIFVRFFGLVFVKGVNIVVRFGICFIIVFI